MQPITVIISSFNRPLHLWASLDSLYRCTRYPHHFVLLDMASDDQLVRRVIAAFERRGLFSQVIRSPRNHPREFWKTVWSLMGDGGEFLGHVDGDVVVEDSEPCWLGAFVALMEQNPKLAMVGPAIDKRDFVSWEKARAVAPDLDDERLAQLIKLNSPERDQDVSQGGARGLVHPHNPPGRRCYNPGSRTGSAARDGDGGRRPRCLFHTRHRVFSGRARHPFQRQPERARGSASAAGDRAGYADEPSHARRPD